jgi:parvulin-like peptidyl-prolyl isomerase
MSRDRTTGAPDRRRRSAAVEAALARPSARQISRRDRERYQRRALIAGIGVIAAIVLGIIGFGAFREFFFVPSQPVALVAGEGIQLRAFTDTLREEMRALQSQVGSEARDATNPGQAGSSVQRLISAQETLPEDVLEKEIENTVIRQEAIRRGIVVPPSEIDAKINANLASQRAILAQPTPTPTETRTPLPTRTPFPEGFEPSPTPEPTATPDPLTPTPTPDPLTPTATREPFPTRLTSTPVLTATPAPTLDALEFDKAYGELKPLLRNEGQYRRGIELLLLREKVRAAIGASVPTRGPQARVQRLASSTIDEGKVALIQLNQFDYPFEEIVSQVGDRPAEGTASGDLGWVALGAQAREFDQVVFSADTPLDTWSEEPFKASNHFEIVKVLERRADAEHDKANIEKMTDRAFKEWLDTAKQSPDIQRDLSAQERQWAVDRASKGIFEETRSRT